MLSRRLAVNPSFEVFVAANINLDLLGLGLGLLGESYLQHALVIVGAHLSRIYRIGERERAGETSVLSLDATEVFFFLFLFDLALAMDRERAALDADISVFCVDARNLKLQSNVVFVFVRCPLAVRNWWWSTPPPGLRGRTTHGKDGSCGSCCLAGLKNHGMGSNGSIL